MIQKKGILKSTHFTKTYLTPLLRTASILAISNFHQKLFPPPKKKFPPPKKNLAGEKKQKQKKKAQ